MAPLHDASTPWDNGGMSGRTEQVSCDASNRRRRAEERRKLIVANRAQSFAGAESWDLDFWQSRTPSERLSALVHLHRDVELARAARDARVARTNEPE